MLDALGWALGVVLVDTIVHSINSFNKVLVHLHAQQAVVQTFILTQSESQLSQHKPSSCLFPALPARL